MFSSWFFFLLSPPSRWGLFVVNDAEYYVENFGVDDHYYPLGGPIAQYSSVTSQQPLKFQGKEWGAPKGLDLYDFGARRYDPASGRWLSQDPLAEKYYAHSPYLFCAANPLNVIDPNGMVDWELLRKGVYCVAGGTATTVGGCFLAGASGGLAGGFAAFIISDGILSIGTGFALITIALVDDQKVVENAESLPTNIPEMGGVIYDELSENTSGKGKEVGSYIDIGINIGSSLISGFDPIIPSVISLASPAASLVDETVSNGINASVDASNENKENTSSEPFVIWDPNHQLKPFLLPNVVF